MSDVQTESRLPNRPCVAGPASFAALAPCLVLYFLVGVEGHPKTSMTAVPHAQTDVTHPTSRCRGRNVTLLPEIIEVIPIFLSRHMNSIPFFSVLRVSIGLCVSAL